MGDKHKYSCNMIADGISINIHTTEPMFLNLYKIYAKDSFSDVKIGQGISNSNLDIFYEATEETVQLDWTPKSVNIKAPWPLMNGGDNFLYLALPLIEAEKQRNNIVTLHAASCSLNESGILLLGKEGAGKTSIIYKLCADYHANLIGNDLTFLKGNSNGMELIGGTKFFFLRKASVEKSLPHLLNLLNSKQVDPWLNKVKVDASDIGISLEKKTSRLQKAFYVHVDEKQEKTFTCSANSLANRLHLNENFSRYIRSSCNVLMDESYTYWGYIPSFDNEQFCKNRHEMINDLYGKYDLKYISGKSADIAKQIHNEITKHNTINHIITNNGKGGYE